MSSPGSQRLRAIASKLSPAVGRTRGEWITDWILFVLALLGWWQSAVPALTPFLPDAWRAWDLLLGAIAAASIWWTRRYPVVVALVTLVPGTLAVSAIGGVLVSIYRLGLLARIGVGIAITALHILAALPYHALVPIPGMTWLFYSIVMPLLYALLLCVGLLGRARRQVIVGLRESAARERERVDERIALARGDERQRIAREMHDVLAHRISLLSMHAGALEFRASSETPPSPEELRESTRVIRRSAHEAVGDLRELLGLLRSDDELGTGAPQPLLEDLPALIEDAREAGQRLHFESDVRVEQLRETTQRTAYRVVQEALTNARKHAPFALVTVRLEQDRHRVRIRAENPLPPGITVWDLPRTGNGLVGLEERVHIDGGELRTTVERGSFVLVAELPVAAR